VAYKIYRSPLQKSDGSWLITDLFAAAWLNAFGHDVLAIEDTQLSKAYSPGTRSAFCFAAKSNFESDYHAFINGEPIGVRKYLDSVYALKKLLREHEERS
jgi:hypothetical protein